MPHDRNGVLLTVGDRVLVPCIITTIQPGDDYCNVTLRAEHAMPPDSTESTIVLNTKQVFIAIVPAVATVPTTL